MNIRVFISVAAGFLALVACQKTVEPEAGLVPMSFRSSDGREVYAFTKSDPLVSSTSHTQMKVWGTRIDASSTTALIPGYKVEYSGAEGWRYDNITGQQLKYWDSFAQSYRFHAAAPFGSVAAISEDGLSLSLSATNSIGSTALYSSPKLVQPSAFGEVVQLAFNQANSRIEIAFVNDSSSDKDLTGVTLTPSTSYDSQGQLDVSYDWSSSPVSTSLVISASAQSNDPLAFAGVSLPTGSAASVFSTTAWYMIPQAMTDCSSSLNWTISFEDGGNHKEAVFSQGKEWRPGYSYKYIFTLGEDSMELELITIADWDQVNINVNTEQISFKIEVEPIDWEQDNKYVHSFEFSNLYSEGGDDVLWATSGLNSMYADTLKCTWAEVTPSVPGDEDYLSGFFRDNTGFKWQTPTRDDFTALLSGDNTVVEMERDSDTKEYGLRIKSKTVATRSIFLPYTESEQIESVFEETKTKVTRTYKGSYWTRDSFDDDSAYLMKYSFTQIEIRTPDGAGGYTSNFSSFEKTGESLFVFATALKTSRLSVRPLVKITR